jgi:hypothetical protein
MTPDLVKAEYLHGYCIKVFFDNGKSGIADFSDLIEQRGIFAKLKDVDYFRQFAIDPEVHVLIWPGQIDLAPETLYSMATGESLPAWMDDHHEYRKAV